MRRGRLHKTRGSSMKRIVATGIALLSLSSVAEAHRLSGTATYYGGSDRLCGRRTASGARIQLRRNDGRTPDAAFRHGTVGPEQRPVDPGHGERSRSVHRRVPGSIAGGRKRAGLPLHPSQRDRDGRANGIRRDRRRESRPSTPRRCGSDAAVLPTDGGRHASDREYSDPQWPWLLRRATAVATVDATRDRSFSQQRSIRPLTARQQLLAVGGLK